MDKLKSASGVNVAIAGVATNRVPPLSPYNSKGKLRNGYAEQRPDIRQVYLGELTSSDLDRSKSAVNGLRDRECAVEIQLEEQRYPFWAFELGEAMPDYSSLYSVARTFASFPSSILSTALAAGKVREDEIFRSLNPRQQAFLDNFHIVISRAGFSKRTICVFLFSEFMNAAIRGTHPAAPIRFSRTILEIENLSAREYYDRRRKEFNPRGWMSPFEPTIDYHGSSCGGLYDPLQSVAKLLNLLERCGDAIKSSGMKFTAFDTMNPYILVGKAQNKRKMTIYAYCGGKLSNGIDCNAFPLMITTHKPASDVENLSAIGADIARANADASSATARHPKRIRALEFFCLSHRIV